jgi:hypothetical protein
LPASEPANIEAFASSSILALSDQKTTVLNVTTLTENATFSRSDNICEFVKVISQVRSGSSAIHLRNNEIILSPLAGTVYEGNPGSVKLPKYATTPTARESVHVLFH